jgi:uncharacterized metal-binding protein YceD (DUF177 family)
MISNKLKINKVFNINKLISFHANEFDQNFIFYGEKHSDWEIVYIDKGCVEVKRDKVELTPIVISEIMMEVPMRVVKEGATLKNSGNGWKVLSEEDAKQDEDYIDPRLAKLKDYFKDKE